MFSLSLLSHAQPSREPFSRRTVRKTSRLRGAAVTESVCPYCAVGCGQLIYTKGGRVIDVEGDPESPIDVGYIPQGYGHSIENVGGKKCRVLIGFNSGVYETIDLSQWVAGNPPDVLATNFGKPAALFEKFPRKDVFITDQDGPGK